MLRRIGAFLLYVKPSEHKLPLLDRIAVFTIYAQALAFISTSIYILRFVIEKNMFLSIFFMLTYIALSVLSLLLFWRSRSIKSARIPLGFLVLMVIVQQFFEVGGIFGLGVVYFLIGLPVIFLFFGLRFSILCSLTYFIGITERLLSGHYNKTTSIYNNPEIIGRMIFIIALGTALSIVVSVCLHFVFRHLVRMAYIDPVTGLANRQQLEDVIRESIIYHSGRSNTLALIGIKALNCNRINALMGTELGDALLREIGQRLSENKEDTILNGRWSGSLFISLIPGKSYAEISEYAKSTLESLEKTYHIDNRTASMLFTVAVSRYPDDAQTAKQLFGNVISLLDQSQNIPGDILFFNKENLIKQQYHFDLIEALNKMDMDKDLRLGYQPKICMSDSSCTGAEVLLRWTDSKQGSISPTVFIPLAEQTGLIRKITRWVIRRTLDDICSEKAQQLIKVSGAVHAINLSMIDLKDREFLSFLETQLAQKCCCAGMIEFEITEGIIVDDDPQIQKNIAGILEMGFGLAIDDFGTGYSSLTYLHKLQVHTLKIDQSFIREGFSENGEGKLPVVDAIIVMGRSLGLEVIAEGVETEIQAEYLLNHGCEHAQGWLYSKDLPFADYINFLETHPH